MKGMVRLNNDERRTRYIDTNFCDRDPIQPPAGSHLLQAGRLLLVRDLSLARRDTVSDSGKPVLIVHLVQLALS